MIALRETTAGVSFSVRVQPRASRTAISGIVGDAVKVALAAPPVEGKANEVLIRFFAELFEVPRAAVEIVSGESSRNKVVRVAGVSAEFVRSRLGV
jgi:uncharacterized protein